MPSTASERTQRLADALAFYDEVCRAHPEQVTASGSVAEDIAEAAHRLAAASRSLV